MNQFLYALAANQLLVIPLAGLVWSICRWDWISRRPALAHGLWMLVLLKCVTPPLIMLPILPTGVPQHLPAAQSRHGDAGNVSQRSISRPLDAERGSPVHADEADVETAVGLMTPAVSASPTDVDSTGPVFASAIIGVSLLISAFLVGMAAFRIPRIERLLKQSEDPSNRVRQLLLKAKRSSGATGAPRLVVVNAAISPMLWVGFRGAIIVVPKKLLESMDDERLLQILAHEMAHYVRRDYASNMFAFLVVSLFWWNPVLWLARRSLQSAAETSCDALTIKWLTGSRRRYAQTLVTVVDFVASSKPRQSAVAASFGESRLLRRRIEMIASSRVQTGISRRGVLVLICAAAALPCMPAYAQIRTTPDKPKATAPDTQPVKSTAKTPKAVADDAPAPRPTPPAQKSDVQNSPKHDERFTTSPFGPVSRNPKFRLPDYLPAAHGNVVEIMPKQYFMLTPLGSTHKWHVRFIPTNMDEILTIPPLQDLKQGQTFPLQKNADTTIVAFVEADFTNDLDIGVRIIDNATGKTRHQCTLLMNASRYQWVGDWIQEE